MDSDLLLTPCTSDSPIKVGLDPLALWLVVPNLYVHASQPLNMYKSININYYYDISNSSSSFKNQKLNLCSLLGSTSASTPKVSFALHSLSQGALLH